MFTGLIESVGEVAEVRETATGLRLRLRTPLAAELRAGDSLAVNGVCLTVIDVTRDTASADIGPETARVTTLGRMRAGQRANL